MENISRPEARERIEKLRKEINYHRYLYHVLNRQEISDEVLDSLKHELKKLEDKFPELITSDSPTQRVAGKPLPGFKKVRHVVRMISLNDVFSDRELKEWEKRIQKLVPEIGLDYFAEIKGDGFAVSLIYKNCMLKVGSTRGDGLRGEDVAENLKTVQSIPLKIGDYTNDLIAGHKDVKDIFSSYPRVKKALENIPNTIEVRGEVYMSKKAFGAINREQKKKGLSVFANPRNIAAGSIRQLDPNIAASRKLDFFAWDLITEVGLETHEEEHLFMKVLGFPTVPLTKYCKDIDSVIAFFNEVNKRREELPFLIDGIVVQVNKTEIFEKLGIVGKAPRGAIAYKFPAKEGTTRIKDIRVQVGRTGVLTPVAVLEPVQIGGVWVSHATLHNMDEIGRLGVYVGDTVIVERAGDVIPSIVKVLKNLRPKHAPKFHMPKTFCGQTVVRRAGEVAYRVPRPEKCELVMREKFYHFVSKKAFDIEGLGPKIVDQLINVGLVEDPADLFSMEEKDLAGLERFAEKSSENLINAIRAKREIELPRFIFALGILHVGEETSLDLAEKFGTLERLASASLEGLERIPNIGGVVAKSIYEWFQNKDNKKFLEKLSKAGVRARGYATQKVKGGFAGMTFVFTGTLRSMDRDEAKSRVRKMGGETSESVSKKISYVVAGDNPGSKTEDARKLGIRIIDEKEFLGL